jgi:hypothetical protein
MGVRQGFLDRKVFLGVRGVVFGNCRIVPDSHSQN